nr:PREDICTED: uncharacterized protein LOC109035114 isoform X1 [Bemisia tabaci]
MDENAWNIDKIQAFYEYVLKERESLRVTDDVLRQCWTLLQVVTSLNDLSPSSLNLQSLLSNSNVQSLCLEQHEFWPRLGATLLDAPSSHYVADLMAQLVDRIYDSGSLMHQELLEKIWEKRGDLKLSMKALEQILKTHPSLLEASLSQLLLKEDICLSAKALWSQPRHSAIVRLAAESPEVFQAATSIMNEILIQTNLTAHIVELIRMFIKGVRCGCTLRAH